MTEELSPSEYARRIGASTRSVQRWIATGRLPARRVGGRWRVAFGATDAPAQPWLTRRADPIRMLFVANRGEIAARIERTCAALGIQCVVPSTDGPAAIDLLDGEAVVRAAIAAGADAIHPGYGFLAESAAFAEHVIGAGLTWVGPPPTAIRAMGDKAAARRLAASLGVPIVPGYDGDVQDDDALRRAARRIGLPVLVKPAAGGGGKGMRVVRRAADLPEALAAARREAAASFGDERLILERLIEGPRHVEVQVLFDEHGHGVHLGERDCSVQRRHQKVLEETPSPAVGPALRAELGEAAIRMASAVGYVSAGTCEFLVGDGSFHFLEMNTRLQVEHPVTEAVTARDLVADQLRIASGETLAAIGLPDQRLVDAALAAGGHAIEVRLYAEDAEAGFLPAIGRVDALRWPSGDGIRVDAGIELGTDVGGRFDPMLAKIIAHGRDRSEAIARLATALDETVVLGLVTNLRFLRWLVRQPWLATGDARIDTLDQAWQPGEGAAATPLPDELAWQAAAAAIEGAPGGPAAAGGPASGSADPWSDGWRVDGSLRLRLAADDGQTRDVDRLAAMSGDELSLPAAVRSGDEASVDVEGRSMTFRIAPPPDIDRAITTARASHVGGPAPVLSPMPGRIVAVHAEVGQVVDVGEALLTLEAMKMEHVVRAPGGGDPRRADDAGRRPDQPRPGDGRHRAMTALR